MQTENWRRWWAARRSLRYPSACLYKGQQSTHGKKGGTIPRSQHPFIHRSRDARTEARPEEDQGIPPAITQHHFHPFIPCTHRSIHHAALHSFITQACRGTPSRTGSHLAGRRKDAGTRAGVHGERRPAYRELGGGDMDAKLAFPEGKTLI